MATASLFQKWRSQTFDDLVGQEIVVRTLKNALDNGKPASAYLFCGPRGTGKTSTARILAKALNCENGPASNPCGKCSACLSIADGTCMDVLEIDAASHTQVDKIREFIVEKVQYAPTEVRYKVYIIDEVHKLSAASFNALLKTLEEPPAHVVFILATTHPHELLPTILSRCQRYDFKRFTLSQISGRIKYVCSQEGLSLDDESAELLARHADGSLRDALVGLEQAAAFCGSHLDAASVSELLGLAGLEAVSGLTEALADQNTASALKVLDELVQNGRDLQKLTSEFLEYLRQLMLVSVKAADNEFLGVSDAYFKQLEDLAVRIKLRDLMCWIKEIGDLQQALKSGSDARLNWELALIKLTVPQTQTNTSALESRIKALESEIAGLRNLIKAPASVSENAPAAAPPENVSRNAALETWKAFPKPVSSVQTAEKISLPEEKEPKPAPAEDSGAVSWNDISSAAVGGGYSWFEAEPVKPAPAKSKGTPPQEVWNKLIGRIKELFKEAYPHLLVCRCVSAVKSVITLQFDSDYSSSYSFACEHQKILEKHCSDLMLREIRLKFILMESSEQLYQTAVKKIINSFRGRLLDRYSTASKI